VQLLKGKDGQLMVPLSALPPALQKELLARARGQDHEHDQGKAGEAK
jgi:hypothetical protein